MLPYVTVLQLTTLSPVAEVVTLFAISVISLANRVFSPGVRVTLTSNLMVAMTVPLQSTLTNSPSSTGAAASHVVVAVVVTEVVGVVVADVDGVVV